MADHRSRRRVSLIPSRKPRFPAEDVTLLASLLVLNMEVLFPGTSKLRDLGKYTRKWKRVLRRFNRHCQIPRELEDLKKKGRELQRLYPHILEQAQREWQATQAAVSEEEEQAGPSAPSPPGALRPPQKRRREKEEEAIAVAEERKEEVDEVEGVEAAISTPPQERPPPIAPPHLTYPPPITPLSPCPPPQIPPCLCPPSPLPHSL